MSNVKLPPEVRAERIRLHNLERGRISNARTSAKRAIERDKKAALRLLVRDCAKSEPKVASVPGQTSDEWEAAGGYVERLPGPHYVASVSQPYGARYG